MKTLRSLVALLAIAAIVVPSMGSVSAAEAGGRQPAMKATASEKKAAASPKKAAGKAESRAKKSKGDKPLKAGKNDGARKKAA